VEVMLFLHPDTVTWLLIPREKKSRAAPRSLFSQQREERGTETVQFLRKLIGFNILCFGEFCRSC
jgi:hypothetical protein